MPPSDTKPRIRPSLLLTVTPPILFLVRDIIATIVVLSYEPGITERAVNNYALHLLPGTLFVVTGDAMLLNAGFGLALGVVLYSAVWYRRYRRYRGDG